MIDITIPNLGRVTGGLDALDKQVRFAVSQTLNQLAQQTIRDLKVEMRDSFDRPTPWTLNSIRQQGLATRDNPQTRIEFKGSEGAVTGIPADKYLRWQVFGGQRRLKRYEKALRRIGVLPDGYFTVTGEGAKLDAYGNVSPGQIVAILSYFCAFQEQGIGFKANSTDATRRRMAKGTATRFGYRYFAGKPGGPNSRGQLGIYQSVRIAAGVRTLLPVLIFVRSTSYQAGRFDLQYTAQLSARRHAAPLFERAMARANATAR